MSVGFFETHRDFFAPTSVRDTLYSLPPANLPDVVATRKDFAAFKASARSLDQGIGAVLHALHDFGLVDNTLVICTTDHGIAFPGAKATLFDRGIGVMMLMRGPGGFTGGKVIDAPVTHLDVYPTLCELAGVEAPDWLQGTSLMPLVRGETERLHEAIFAETTYHAAYQPHRAVRTERWKYIRRFDDYQHPVLANCDDERQQGPLGRGGLGRADRARGAALRPGSRPGRGRQPRRRPGPRRGRWRRCGAGSTPGCGRPRTRCSTARWSRRRGRSSTSSGRSRPTTRPARSRRIPRPLHPAEAGPAGHLGAAGVTHLALAEGAEAAVV